MVRDGVAVGGNTADKLGKFGGGLAGEAHTSLRERRQYLLRVRGPRPVIPGKDNSNTGTKARCQPMRTATCKRSCRNVALYVIATRSASSKNNRKA